MKRVLVLVIVIVISLVLNVIAQVTEIIPHQSERIYADQDLTTSIHHSYEFHSNTSVNWILVDTLPNAFGPNLWLINPIAYEAVSNTAGFVHRGHTTYAAGTGELWYNLSTDAGESWFRVTSVNSSLPLNARYPSMALSNPYNGGIGLVRGIFTWGELLGGLGYGYANPIVWGTTSAYVNSNYSEGAFCWAEGDWMFWSNGNVLFRTLDFNTIEIIDVLDSSTNFLSLGGVSLNSNVYIGYLGTFDHPDPNDPIYSGWYPAYIKSSDNGLTWQQVQVLDFRTIEGLEEYDRLFDFIKSDNFVSFAGDINVDKDGYVHLIISVTDTTTNSTTGINSLVEIYETSSGWKGKVIYEGINDMIFTTREGPAFGQMGPSGYLAFDKEREVMVCVWVMDNKNSAMQLCDVYISYRTLNSEWSAPINLTETNNMNENGAHLAPTLKKNTDGSYTAFVGYFYQLDYFGPDPINTASTGFWIAPVTFSVTDIHEGHWLVERFSLNQNYPNPFNPSTKISWQSPVGSHQSIKVFDMLGREVATLVDEYRNVGSYEINFDASKLSSGVYYYQLKAGDFVETKKMILLR